MAELSCFLPENNRPVRRTNSLDPPRVSSCHVSRLAGPLVWLMLAAACPGCTLVSVDYAAIPSPEAVFGLKPGRTTRFEVMARLGPPDEYRRPAPGERGRPLDPRSLHSREEHRVFGRSRFTYARERVEQRRLDLLLFKSSVTNVTTDRVVLFFDDQGVLQDVSFEWTRES